MSKVTPSALRGLSVAAGTVSLAAVGAALAAPAGAAAGGLPGLGGGLPLSTNALSAVKGLTAHNGGQIAGVPIAGLPVLNQLPQMMDSAAPGVQAVPGLSGVDFGAPQDAPQAAQAAQGVQTPHAGPAGLVPQTQKRSRTAETGRPSPAHLMSPAPAAPAPAPAAPAPAAPANPALSPAPAGAPASATPSAAAAQTAQIASQASPTQTSAPAAPAKTASPLDNLPVVGGIAGGLPLLGGASPLGGLPIGGLGKLA